MKPPLFHVGQAVEVCGPANWCIVAEGEHGSNGPHPKQREVCHIGEHSECYEGEWYYELHEYSGNGAYCESWLRAVEEMPAEAYAELLEAFEPVTA